MQPRTILILTIGYGAGHRRAARAVVQACEKQIPECTAQIVDVTPLLPRWLRWFMMDLYFFLLRRAPSLWRRIERVQRDQDRTLPLWVARLVAHRIHEKVKQAEVAAMVSTEVGVNEIVAVLKRRRYPEAPLLAVITDYDVDRAWKRDEVNAYAVGSTEVREELAAFGVASENIFVTGIPIDQRFVRPPEGPPSPRWKVGVSPSPKILISGGGEGLLDVERLLLQLDAIAQTGTATVLVGRNHRLHRALLQFDRLTRLQLRIEGWSSDMPHLFMTHDLLVAKPGGITLTEAMAAGLPILACYPLPGSEEKHCALVEKWGIGLSARTDEEFAQKAPQPLRDQILRKTLSEKAQQTYQSQHGQSLAAVLRRLLKLPIDPNEQLRNEFNQWAEAGRGEQMEKHHAGIAEPALDRMRIRLEDTVLDLGCGTGWAARRMARRAVQGTVWGVDISGHMIAQAAAHPQNPAHLKFRTASVDALPFSENYFDKIFSCESFYYYPDLHRAAQQVLRVLKPGGSFYCLVNLFKENPYTHIWVDLLKVKAHLLGEKDYQRLFFEAGFARVKTFRIPDKSPLDEANFKPGWGIETIDNLKDFKKIGALLVVASKGLSEPRAQ